MLALLQEAHFRSGTLSFFRNSHIRSYVIARSSIFNRLLRRKALASDVCALCPLTTCRRGRRAVVVSLGCEEREACRLRTLGLFEGSSVTVLDSRNGFLLDVRGSRLALAAALAGDVMVRPISG